MPTIITPNMGLIEPVVGQEPGPTWANDLNASLGILDQHNHSTGQGVQITPTGLNINIDLPMQGNNLTQVNTVRFQALSVSLPGISPDLGCIYVAGNELYYNDESGNVIAITKTGSVNAGAGSITGLPSGTASASYNSLNQTFVWQSATNTPANMDGGSFIFRDITANSNGITVNAPTALSTNYQLFWPAAQAASNNSLLTVNTSGNMSYSVVDGTTLQVSSGILSIPVGGITQGLLAPRSTGTTVGAGGVAIAPSAGSYNFSTVFPSFVSVPALNVTITTTGRPVRLFMQPITNASGAFSIAGGTIYIRPVNLTNSADVTILTSDSAPGVVTWLDMSVNGVPGTYNYEIEVAVTSGTSQIVDCELVAYEI